MIDELRRLLGEATPRPWLPCWAWSAKNDGYVPTISNETPEERDADDDEPWPQSHNYAANARLIAAAVNALPSLLARLEAAEAVVEKAREAKQTDEAWHSLQEDHASALAADPERGESGFEDDLGEMGAALDRSYLALFKALAHYDAVRKETR